MTNQNPEPRLRAGIAIRHNATDRWRYGWIWFSQARFRRHMRRFICTVPLVEHNDQRLLIIAFDLAAVSCNTVRNGEEISFLWF